MSRKKQHREEMEKLHLLKERVRLLSLGLEPLEHVIEERKRSLDELADSLSRILRGRHHDGKKPVSVGNVSDRGDDGISSFSIFHTGLRNIEKDFAKHSFDLDLPDDHPDCLRLDSIDSFDQIQHILKDSCCVSLFFLQCFDFLGELLQEAGFLSHDDSSTCDEQPDTAVASSVEAVERDGGGAPCRPAKPKWVPR